MTDVLRVDRLRVEYLTPKGRVCVVDDVSFEVRAGEIFGLAGESGSGKTTIGQAILRVLKPPAVITGGRVTVAGGRDVLDLDDAELRALRWRQMSLVMQSALDALNPVITVGEQIIDAIEAHEQVSRRVARDRAAELLQMVGIDPARMRSHAHELSGGMRQRVVIAMAMALKPPLVIMDEPTTALDVLVQRELLAQLTALRDRLGFAVVFITHDLSLMLEMCNRVAVLYAGRLAEVAGAREIAESPKHPYTKALLAAFPDVRRRAERLHGIGGSPPDPRNPPAGCRFHPRCTSVIDVCSATEPPLIEVGSGRKTACHLVTP
jgi:peptide/nickel transport system ATP-binding protein